MPVSSTSHEIGSSQYGNAPDGTRKQAHYLNDCDAATSKSSKLPHWLQEALGALSPSLPPSVYAGPIELPARSSVGQCSNMLHGGMMRKGGCHHSKYRPHPSQLRILEEAYIRKRKRKEGEGSLLMVGVSNPNLHSLSLDLNFLPISCQDPKNDTEEKCEERKECSNWAVYVVIDSSSDEELD